jgi:predicted transcriptional regulator
MSSFNKVFGVVQKHCMETNQVAGIDALKAISSEVGIPLDRLHFYLECLHEVGVIRYSGKDKTISLTAKGVKAIRVFP